MRRGAIGSWSLSMEYPRYCRWWRRRFRAGAQPGVAGPIRLSRDPFSQGVAARPRRASVGIGVARQAVEMPNWWVARLPSGSTRYLKVLGGVDGPADVRGLRAGAAERQPNISGLGAPTAL